MKYLIVPVLICAGAAQAHADSLLGGNSTFIGANVNNPILNLQAGAAIGQHNSTPAGGVTQHSFINVYGVQDVAVGGSNPSNNTAVKQKGFVNAFAGQNVIVADPSAHRTNTTKVGQIGFVDYADVGQHIQSLPAMPSVLP